MSEEKDTSSTLTVSTWVCRSQKPFFIKEYQLSFTCPDWTFSGRAVIRWPPHPCVWLSYPEVHNTHRTGWHTWEVWHGRSFEWRLQLYQCLHFCCGGECSSKLLWFCLELLSSFLSARSYYWHSSLTLRVFVKAEQWSIPHLLRSGGDAVEPFTGVWSWAFASAEPSGVLWWN